jgi:hypothetical protein
MPIKVLVKYIDNEKIQESLNHYNFNKSHDEEPIEILDRCEGGFQIKIIQNKNNNCDINKKIKQLRWKNGFLLSQNYIGFSKKEELLLFNSLVIALGNNNVLLLEH